MFNLFSGDQTPKNWLKWRRPPTEDDLKILGAEYLIRSSQMFNISLNNEVDQTKNKFWKFRWHPTDDDPKILEATTDQIFLV